MGLLAAHEGIMSKTLAKSAKAPTPKRRRLPDLSGPVQRPTPGGARKFKAEGLRKAVDILFDKFAARAQV